ncbi:putative phage domain protein, partial [Escherichia coli 1-176-05_S3_C1]
MSLKSQGITRKRTAKLVSLYGVVKFSSTVRFRLWHSAKWRGGKYGG